MYKIDNSTAVVTRPAATAPGTPGFFTDGSAGGGVPATILPAEWLNAVQDEMDNVLLAAGIAPNKAVYTQLRDAILTVLQSSPSNYALDTGTANTYVVAFTPSITAAADGMKLRFKAKTANSGASTLAVNGLAATAIVGGAHAALQGGEIVANGDVEVVWNSTLAKWVLLEQTGGATQVAAATQSSHAIQLAQMAAIVGGARNSRMSVSTASATATFAADEVAVKNALGGASWLLSNFSQTVNLATTGAGGMDTGTAPVSGYVALYAIYNPTSGATSILATNATASAVPNVYGGANMPAGYTASALVSVVPTNASKLIIPFVQLDRVVSIPVVVVLNNGIIITPITAANIGTAVPPNARRVSGGMSANSSAASNMTVSVYAASSGAGIQGLNTPGGAIPFTNLGMTSTQQLFYTTSSTAGTPAFVINVTGYEF